LKARDIMSSKPIVMHKDDRLENVLDAMRRHNVSKLPVVDRDRLVGVVSDGDVLEELGAFRNRSIEPSTLHVSSAMRKDFPVAVPDTDLKVVIEHCKKEGMGLLPVIDHDPGGKLVGVITKADLLPLVTSTTPLRDVMKRQLHSVEPADRLVHARRMMMDHGIERLPVLEAGRIVGILSEMDIALALDEFKKKYPPEHQKHQIKNLLVEDVMRREVVTAGPDTPASKAARLMRDRGIGGLPVTEDGDRIAGMVTRTDLIRLL
jgi:CBS domain-containing protein